MKKQNREVRAQARAKTTLETLSFEKTLTIAEVAQILRIHRNTVYKLIRRSDLPGLKIGENRRVTTHRLYERYLRANSDSKVPLRKGLPNN